jgi:hypothetical protein
MAEEYTLPTEAVMKRVYLALVLVSGVGVLSFAAEKKFTPIDIQSKANVKLTDDFHGDNAGNNLAEVPKGEQTFKDVKFKIEEKCLQLGSVLLKETNRDFPEKFEGIAVGKPFAKLHILHAMGHGVVFEREPDQLPKDKVVAKFTVHYEDKSTEAIPVVYDEDVVDWWYAQGVQHFDRVPTKAQIGWEGKNDAARKIDQADLKMRLYLTTWKNPKPDKKVTHIDYATTTFKEGPAAFCVALTAEE